MLNIVPGLHSDIIFIYSSTASHVTVLLDLLPGSSIMFLIIQCHTVAVLLTLVYIQIIYNITFDKFNTVVVGGGISAGGCSISLCILSDDFKFGHLRGSSYV